MSNNQHARKLRRGAASWNKWVSRKGASFRADLSGADLQGLGLKGANLTGANLREANLTQTDLKAAQLRAADLSGAVLMGARLREADLRDTNLRGARLDNADLTGVRLRGSALDEASLFGTELGGAMLDGAALDSAVSDETTRWPKGFTSEPGTESSEPLDSPERTVAPPASISVPEAGAPELPAPAEPPPPDSLQDPELAAGPGRRVTDLSEPERRSDALAALVKLIATLWEIQFSNRLSELEDAELQSQIAILETLSRNPSGPNLIVSERAIAAAMKIVVRNMSNRNEEIRTILDLAMSLGAEDPREDGETINAVLQSSVTAPAGFDQIDTLRARPYLPRPLVDSLHSGLLSLNVDAADFSTRLAWAIVALLASVWQPTDRSEV